VSGVEFGTSYAGRVLIPVDGLDALVPFVGLQALLRNKLASGRPQTSPTTRPCGPRTASGAASGGSSTRRGLSPATSSHRSRPPRSRPHRILLRPAVPPPGQRWPPRPHRRPSPRRPKPGDGRAPAAPCWSVRPLDDHLTRSDGPSGSRSSRSPASSRSTGRWPPRRVRRPRPARHLPPEHDRRDTWRLLLTVGQVRHRLRRRQPRPGRRAPGPPQDRRRRSGPRAPRRSTRQRPATRSAPPSRPPTGWPPTSRRPTGGRPTPRRPRPAPPSGWSTRPPTLPLLAVAFGAVVTTSLARPMRLPDEPELEPVARCDQPARIARPGRASGSSSPSRMTGVPATSRWRTPVDGVVPSR
jgi:hypothetical protein